MDLTPFHIIFFMPVWHAWMSTRYAYLWWAKTETQVVRTCAGPKQDVQHLYRKSGKKKEA